MIELKLNILPEKQRQLWTMRYRYGWRMKRIALKLGLSESGVSKMLARMHKRLGIPKYRVSVIRKKRKRIRVRRRYPIRRY